MPLDDASAGGLTSSEARDRLGTFGRNEIVRVRPPGLWRLAARQFASPLVWLLLAASGASFVLGSLLDGAVIGAIVVINAAIGVLQEHRAERAIQALSAMTAPRARVIRDRRMRLVPAPTLVPGDRIVLEAGDIVPADARLCDAHGLRVDEAVLTGESGVVDKRVVEVAAGTPLAERRDIVFMGTSIAAGTGVAAVVATGMRTELGRVAHLLATVEDRATPLQRRLARVSLSLAVLCLAIVAAVSVDGYLRGSTALQVFTMAVALAVASVPEGLPAVVTVALAAGVQRMAGRRVVVRRLPAVETLGCATVVCTDKTGTLTTGVMTVRELWGVDHDALLFAGAACCDAELHPDGRGGVGDPTELAILMAAAARGIHRPDIEREAPRVTVSPFDQATRQMSIERSDGRLYVKGAVERVLASCGGDLAAALEVNRQMARQGLRVLAVAVGHGGAPLALRGLVGVADPPRPEAIEAVAAARRAGITVVMVTGDHAETAAAVARELGIVAPADGPPAIHARATPEDKVAIVRAWQARGAVVAMTGDGVNDAPALREADIGVAMGRGGTDVAREAADVVLADDNFASIVAGVAEGRGIFDNIRKTVVYLLAGNASELLAMAAAAFAGLPPPLLPLHLLWINVVTDGLPALALVLDPPAPDVLDRPPRRADEPMLGRREWRTVVAIGLLEALLTLGVFTWALGRHDLAAARGMAFSTLVCAELFRAFAARSPHRLFGEVGAFSNVRLLGVVAGSALLQVALHHVPPLRAALQVAPMTAAEWMVILPVALTPVSVIELWKLRRRRA